MTAPVWRCALVKERDIEGGRVRGPGDAARRLWELIGRDADREHMVALYLDAQNRVVGAQVVTIGLLNSSLVHPREVYKPAIVASAASVILGHNHPSGDPEPSPEDLRVTAQLVEAGKLVGIPVRDHVIVGEGESYVSLMERGVVTVSRWTPAS